MCYESVSEPAAMAERSKVISQLIVAIVGSRFELQALSVHLERKRKRRLKKVPTRKTGLVLVQISEERRAIMVMIHSRIGTM